MRTQIRTGGSPCQIGESPGAVSGRGKFLKKTFWPSKMAFGDPFGRWVDDSDPRSLMLNSGFRCQHAQLCQEWEHERLKEKAAQLSLVRKTRVHQYVWTATGCRGA